MKNEFAVYAARHKDIDRCYKTALGNDELVFADPIRVGTEEFLFYSSLTTTGYGGRFAIGSGEADAITLAHYRGGAIASNNLKDVHVYAKMLKIELITTSDVIFNANRAGILTDQRAEEIWSLLVQSDRRMPTSTFKEFRENKEKDNG